MQNYPKIKLPFLGTNMAVLTLEENVASLITTTLNIFENNPVTMSQVTAIMADSPVTSLSVFELEQVRRFHQGATALTELIRQDLFDLSIGTTCFIHNIVGQEEALKWGEMRDLQVHIGRLKYKPPMAFELPILSREVFFNLQQINDPILRACMTFLDLSKTQFFFDCNKRTALLMMTGELLKHGYPPLFFLSENTQEFVDSLIGYYEQSDETQMLNLFSKTATKLCQTLYSKAN